MVTALTVRKFSAWLREYGRASLENQPDASAELFADGAEYYETPFEAPLVGKEAIRRYWAEGARALKDKTASFEVLSVRDQVGIARWQSTFVGVASGHRIALDCVFVVEFDDGGKCRRFREWWHRKILDADPGGA